MLFALLLALELGGERGLHRAAPFVSEHDEERRAQMHARVLQRAHHFGRDDVAGDAHDEELAEAGIEHQLRRHARVAAAEDGRVGTLALGELGQQLLLHGRETGTTANESLVSCDQARERFLGRAGMRCSAGSDLDVTSTGIMQRVSPEIVFDQGIGDLFVVRTAGPSRRRREKMATRSRRRARQHLHRHAGPARPEPAARRGSEGGNGPGDRAALRPRLRSRHARGRAQVGGGSTAGHVDAGEPGPADSSLFPSETSAAPDSSSREECRRRASVSVPDPNCSFQVLPKGVGRTTSGCP